MALTIIKTSNLSFRTFHIRTTFLEITEIRKTIRHLKISPKDSAICALESDKHCQHLQEINRSLKQKYNLDTLFESL